MKRTTLLAVFVGGLIAATSVINAQSPPPPSTAETPTKYAARGPKADASSEHGEWDLPGWKLTWHDEFHGPKLDTDKWEVLTRKKNHNNELQYYLPDQASIVDGQLLITATNEPLDGKPYRSARLFSWHHQAYGRFEARAKIPTTKGIWPAIWLLPRGIRWPTGGEIDIMEHKGSEPTMVSSAYHYATDLGNHSFQESRYQPDPPVKFPDGYHLYTVEWDPGQIKFFVDGVCYKTVSGQYISDEPMGFVINTAVGGWFDGEPDESTVFPQTFYVDHVRVWKRISPAPEIERLLVTDTGLLVNGSFDVGTRPWVAEGTVHHAAHRNGLHPVTVAYEGMGYHSIKMYGQAKISQDDVKVQPGKTYDLSLHVRTNSDDTINGTDNSLEIKIDFLNIRGHSLEDGAVKYVAADGKTVEDQWLPVQILASAPKNAVTATVTIAFVRSGNEEQRGAVWIDAVSMHEVNDVGASLHAKPTDGGK